MQAHEFYSKYANVPSHHRLHLFNLGEQSLTSLDMVYERVKELDNKIRPMLIERDQLIASSEKFILEHQA